MSSTKEVEYHDTWLFIFGGMYRSRRHLLTNDLKVIICSKPVISIHNVPSTSNNSRSGSSINPNNKNNNDAVHYEYGDPCTWQWELINPRVIGTSPPPLCNHLACILPLSNIYGGTRMLVLSRLLDHPHHQPEIGFGGTRPVIYALKCQDLHQLEWELVGTDRTVFRNSSLYPSSFEGYTLTVINDDEYKKYDIQQHNNNNNNNNNEKPLVRLILIGGVTHNVSIKINKIIITCILHVIMPIIIFVSYLLIFNHYIFCIYICIL